VKVIFLDMDGVLNSEEFLRRRDKEPNCAADRWENNIDPAGVSRLNRIIAETGAKVVISSTWRKVLDYQEMERLLKLYGFVGEVVGQTPDFSKRHWYGTGVGHCYERGHEIREWLREQMLGVHMRSASFVPTHTCGSEHVEQYVILDDSSDMATVKHRHIWCDPAVGLDDEGAERAIQMLKEPMEKVA
jgi:hypothetical protein